MQTNDCLPAKSARFVLVMIISILFLIALLSLLFGEGTLAAFLLLSSLLILFIAFSYYLLRCQGRMLTQLRSLFKQKEPTQAPATIKHCVSNDDDHHRRLRLTLDDARKQLHK